MSFMVRSLFGIEQCMLLPVFVEPRSAGAPRRAKYGLKAAGRKVTLTRPFRER